MEYKDYYKTLGVERSATAEEIRAAYRKLARKYHPDVSKEKNAEAHFKEVGEAYEVLKDTDKREAYDQLGSNWKQGQDFRPPPGWNPNGGSAGFEFRTGQGGQGEFSDFFSSIFGNMGGGFGNGGFNQQGFGQNAGTRQNTRGQNQHTKIQIDLEDSMHGAKRNISLRSASGDRSLTVNIPKGIKAGQKIRLNGQGQSGFGGSGDLLLEVEFNPHRLYKIDGSDLTMTLPVAPWEAALGATVKIPLPDGTQVDVKIPANSRSGRKMRLKEKGLPSKPVGDLYLSLEIVLPVADTARAKEWYAQMATELAFNPRANW